MTKLLYKNTKIEACEKLYEVLFDRKNEGDILGEIQNVALAYAIIDNISSSSKVSREILRRNIFAINSGFLSISGIQISLKPDILKLKDAAKCIVRDYSIAEEYSEGEYTVYEIECYPNITNIYHLLYNRIPYSTMVETQYLLMLPERQERIKEEYRNKSLELEMRYIGCLKGQYTGRHKTPERAKIYAKTVLLGRMKKAMGLRKRR